MRVIVVSLAAIMLLFSPMTEAGGLSFGLLGGINQSDFSFEYTEVPGLFDPDQRTGFRLGLFAEREIKGLLSLQLGMDYNERGYSVSVPVLAYQGVVVGAETWRPYVLYLSFPLLLKARPEMGRLDPFVMIGPRFDVNIGESETLGELAGGFGDTQWGWTLGGGGEIALTPRLSLMVAVLYNADFDEAYRTDLLMIDRSSIDFVAGVRF